MKTYASVSIVSIGTLIQFCLLFFMVERSMGQDEIEPEITQNRQNTDSDAVVNVLKQEFCPFIKVEVLLEQLDKHVDGLQQNAVRLDVKTDQTEASLSKLDNKMDILREKVGESISISRSLNHQQQLIDLQSDAAVLIKTTNQLRNEVGNVRDMLRTNKYGGDCHNDGTNEIDDSSPSGNFNGGPDSCYRNLPEDCWDLLKRGNATSGVYDIYPFSYCRQKRIQVYCDMETDGGGWTVFQRRGDFHDPREDFYRTWFDYKWGFGNLRKEFWLGLEYLAMITNSRHSSLRIDLGDFDGNKRYAFYRHFYILGEADKYRIKFSDYSGDAGDALGRSKNMRFTTKDEDNDVYDKNCAESFSGAWWYKECHDSNLNGKYLVGNHTSFANGVNWRQWLGYHYSLKFTEMKTRPIRK